MRYSIKATLLSALIFPGLGQLLLRHYKTGLLMLVVAFTCMATVVTQALSKSMQIISQLEQSGAIIDEASIARSVEQASQNYDGTLVNLAMFGLIACWLISVVHAYLAGRARDAEEASAASGNNPGNQP